MLFFLISQAAEHRAWHLLTGHGRMGASLGRGMVIPVKSNIFMLIYSRSHSAFVCGIGSVSVYAVTEGTLSWQVHGSLARRLVSVLFPGYRNTGFSRAVSSADGLGREAVRRFTGYCGLWFWGWYWILQSEEKGADFTSQQKSCQECACQMAVYMILRALAILLCVWLKNYIRGLRQGKNKRNNILNICMLLSRETFSLKKLFFQSWKSQRTSELGYGFVRSPAPVRVATIQKGSKDIEICWVAIWFTSCFIKNRSFSTLPHSVLPMKMFWKYKYETISICLKPLSGFQRFLEQKTSPWCGLQGLAGLAPQ